MDFHGSVSKLPVPWKDPIFCRSGTQGLDDPSEAEFVESFQLVEGVKAAAQSQCRFGGVRLLDVVLRALLWGRCPQAEECETYRIGTQYDAS